jgi:hypothetical protein
LLLLHFLIHRTGIHAGSIFVISPEVFVFPGDLRANHPTRDAGATTRGQPPWLHAANDGIIVDERLEEPAGQIGVRIQGDASSVRPAGPANALKTCPYNNYKFYCIHPPFYILRNCM